LGDGRGGFSDASGSPFAAGNGMDGIVVADFNKDGNLDLAATAQFDNTVLLFAGDGLGGFSMATSSPFPVGNGPNSIVGGDFNRDGKADFAAANVNDNTV